MVMMLVLPSLCATAQTQQPATGEASKTGSITGRVVNESGQPLQNAEVSVQAVGATRISDPVTTDREGAFRVSGLNPVSYTIRAGVPGYVSAAPEPDGEPPKQYKVG